MLNTYSLLLSPCNTTTCAPAHSFYCSPPFPIPFSIPLSLSSLPSPLPLLSSPLLLPLPLSPLSPSNHPFLRSLFLLPSPLFRPPFSSFPLSLSFSYPSPFPPPFPLLTLPLTTPTPTHPPTHIHTTYTQLGETALHLAVDKEHEDIVELLLEANADQDLPKKVIHTYHY